MSEQPTTFNNQLSSKEGAIFDDSVYEARVDLHVHTVPEEYNAVKIAEIRDAPRTRQPTLEEWNVMATHEASKKLSDLLIARAERVRSN